MYSQQLLNLKEMCILESLKVRICKVRILIYFYIKEKK